MNTLVVDDKVTLTEKFNTTTEFLFCPYGVTGKVTEVTPKGWYRVTWPNGHSYSFKADELIKVEPDALQNISKPKQRKTINKRQK